MKRVISVGDLEKLLILRAELSPDLKIRNLTPEQREEVINALADALYEDVMAGLLDERVAGDRKAEKERKS